MATTKILPVRKRLKDCLDYAANPKKTEIFRGDALDRLMHYTQNEDKTEHQLYVTGFNCDPQNACLIMEATKRRWTRGICITILWAIWFPLWTAKCSATISKPTIRAYGKFPMTCAGKTGCRS